MPDTPVKPAARPPRATIAGLSALLVVGVLLGASLSGAETAALGARSEAAHRDRLAPRQFAASLARAVRELVGEPQKPVLQPAWVAVAPSAIRIEAAPTEAAPLAAPIARIALALLDLPPPSRRA
ncbi:MAG: hypothetical protein WD749_09900 [Phycisphaerales bacterium]